MFRCNFMECTKNFEEVTGLLDHMKLRHNMSEFNCVLCNDRFTSIFTYKRHIVNELARNQRKSVQLLKNLPFHGELNEQDGHGKSTSTDITSNIIDVPKELEEEIQFEHFASSVFEMILDLYGDMGLTKKLAVDITKQLKNLICKPLLRNLLLQMQCKQDKDCLKKAALNIEVAFDELKSEHTFKNLLKRNNLYFEATSFNIAGEVADSRGYLFPLKDNISSLFSTKPDLLLDMLITYENMSSEEHYEPLSSLVNAEVWKEKAKNFTGK